MQQMLGVAMKWKAIGANPMELLDRPAHDRDKIDPFEISEVTAILEHSAESRYAAAIRLAFACGLRGGELWGCSGLTFATGNCPSSVRRANLPGR